MVSIIDKINKDYFWDVNPENLNVIQSKRLIIERIMNFGNLNEIKLIRKFYGEEEIKNNM